MVWAAFFDLAPGDQRAVTFEYQLPDGMAVPGNDGLHHYRLLVQKQPGTEAVPLQVEVTLPPGAVLAGDEGGVSGGVRTISTDLRADRAFHLQFRPGP
jgi:hypothetical protein